jgi:nitroreductase
MAMFLKYITGGSFMVYFEYFKKPIEETIRKRVSCRTYQDRLLTEEDKKRLLDFCQKMTHGLHGEKISYQLIEHNAADLKKRKLVGYGLFRNARSFIVGIIERSDLHHLSYGYLMEHVVLKATELGLGTCWAGDFHPYLIKNIPVSDHQTIPAICLVGYAAVKRTLIEKAARLAIQASRRKDWNKSFFEGDFKTPLTPETAGSYAEPLELLRLAPSSGNTQPWRVVKEKGGDVFHFFKKVINKRYEKKKLHDIDIGIAMCHFKMGAAKNRLTGAWRKTEHKIPDVPAGTIYIVSWTPK